MTSQPSNMSENIANTFAKAGSNSKNTDDEFIYASKYFMKDLGRPLIDRIIASSDEPIAFFDSACGPGVLTQELYKKLTKEALSKSKILCADFSGGMVDLVNRRVKDENWTSVETKILDAQNTELPGESFSHIGIGLGLHIIPDPDAAVKDALRTLKPGGKFGASTFAASNGEKFWIPDAVSAFDALPFEAPFPTPLPMQIHNSGSWTDPNWIAEHLEKLGVKDVEVELVHGTTHYENARQYTIAFKMMLGFLMQSYWSEETRKAHPVEEVLPLVEKHLQDKYEGKGWDVKWDIIYMTGTK